MGKLAEQLTSGLKFEGTNPVVAGRRWKWRGKNCEYQQEAMASLVEQSTSNPKFAGLNLQTLAQSEKGKRVL